MWTIAKLAYKELLYKRIFFIPFLMSVAFLIFYAVATHFAADQTLEGVGKSGGTDTRLTLENLFVGTQLLGIGLYFSSFITILLAILGSIGSISGEVESHQMDTLLARPITRQTIILGKFTGLACVLIVYALLMFLGIIFVNQEFAGPYLAVQLSLSQLIHAGSLYLLQPIIVVAVSLLFSSRLTTMSGGIIMIILYGISFVGGFLEQFGALFHNSSLTNTGIVTSLIFPVDSLFRKMTLYLFDSADDPVSFASQGIFASASTPSDAMIGYAILYSIIALVIATRIFAKRDL
ncbi:ABC transporter permease [Brevibacillus ginsengisoli]|uniref:ABC transporter permease n=1 Tax=Brevibacillus ginsengisoli TaxID=363854 RepID=UPI003CEF884F